MRPERQPRLLGSASGPQAGEWGAAGQGVGACRAPVGAGQHGATETWGSCHVEEADARRDTHTHTPKKGRQRWMLCSLTTSWSFETGCVFPPCCPQMRQGHGWAVVCLSVLQAALSCCKLARLAESLGRLSVGSLGQPWAVAPSHCLYVRSAGRRNLSLNQVT